MSIFTTLTIKWKYVPGLLLSLKTLFPFIKTCYTFFCYLRSPKSRVKFNTRASEWSSCMATCPKYNRATVPYFTDMTSLDQLIGWLRDTTTDPVEKTLYPGVLSPTIWIPIRCVTIIMYMSAKKTWRS